MSLFTGWDGLNAHLDVTKDTRNIRGQPTSDWDLHSNNSSQKAALFRKEALVGRASAIYEKDRETEGQAESETFYLGHSNPPGNKRWEK